MIENQLSDEQREIANKLKAELKRGGYIQIVSGNASAAIGRVKLYRGDNNMLALSRHLRDLRDAGLWCFARPEIEPTMRWFGRVGGL